MPFRPNEFSKVCISLAQKLVFDSWNTNSIPTIAKGHTFYSLFILTNLFEVVAPCSLTDEGKPFLHMSTELFNITAHIDANE